jgi:parallel beta-helix repeat protein
MNFRVIRLTAAMITILAIGLLARTIVIPDDAKSIQTGIDKANAGDTVYVKKGIYKESIVLKNEVSLIGESTNGTIIHGKGRGAVILGGDDALIKKVTIQNGAIGIRCENTSTTIEQCLIKDNKETGIHCLVYLPNIVNSVIYRNRWTGIYCESTRSMKTSIEHNIIAENGYSGIKLAGKSEVLIINNVFTGNKEFGIWTGEESRKTRVIYNNFSNNRASYNFHTQADRSNINEHPQYDYDGKEYNFYGATPTVLLGKGKDGATIGIISESAMNLVLTDSDNDGVPNETDGCQSLPEDIDNFEDEDGCPDFDNDKDGIYDSQDHCPDLAEDIDGFKDDDGCDDFDNDNDNIPDSADTCPNNAETYNSFKDDDGCPDEVQNTK